MTDLIERLRDVNRNPPNLQERQRIADEIERLREMLRRQAQEAYEDVENWGGYASDYFAEKWDLAGTLRKWKDRARRARKRINRQ